MNTACRNIELYLDLSAHASTPHRGRGQRASEIRDGRVRKSQWDPTPASPWPQPPYDDLVRARYLYDFIDGLPPTW